MEITIQPHRWVDKSGKHAAHYFPFVDGEPCHELANCSKCAAYRGEGTCEEWVGKEDEAPMFCGPICHKFRVV